MVAWLRAVSNGATLFHFILFHFKLKTQNIVPFSNGRWTLYSEVIKKDEYNESVHSSSRHLLSDSTHRERYYESATHHVNTPKRTGAYCCLPQVEGVLLFASVVRCKIRGVGWRGSLLLQTHKHCIQQQRGVSADYAVKKLQQYSSRSTS